MSHGPSPWSHLVRLAALIGLGAASFAFARPFFIPDTFGDIGHYRAAAVDEARARPLQHADGALCATCHSEVDAARQQAKSKHAPINCQSCHGPLAAHVDSGGEKKPALPDVVPLCTRCHERTAGRPAWMPQVNSAEHSSGERCVTCHSPHTPGIS